MKFKDLQFKRHPKQNLGYASRATYTFPNKYGISVITDDTAYYDKGTYEVAIMYDGAITYATELTNDVLRYQSKEDIDAIIMKLERYPAEAVAAAAADSAVNIDLIKIAEQAIKIQ